jgi:hypothetical protein
MTSFPRRCSVAIAAAGLFAAAVNAYVALHIPPSDTPNIVFIALFLIVAAAQIVPVAGALFALGDEPWSRRKKRLFIGWLVPAGAALAVGMGAAVFGVLAS